MQLSQRWLHYYCFNELASTLLILWLVVAAAWPSETWPVAQYLFHTAGDSDARPTVTSRVLRCVGLYALAFSTVALSMCAVLVLRRQCRTSRARARQLSKLSPRFPGRGRDSFREITVVARDGFELLVRTTATEDTFSTRQPKKPIMLLCAGLGCSNADILTPIMCHYGDAFTYVSWDYRGLFKSSHFTTSKRPLSIAEHARDARDILQALHGEGGVGGGRNPGDTIIVGHSMGSCVAFEFALLFPAQVHSLIILNGFHGHIYSTGGQPICRLPFAADFISAAVELLLSHTAVLRCILWALQPPFRAVVGLYGSMWQSPSTQLVQSMGPTYLLDFVMNYFGDIMSSPRHAQNWLTCIHELQAFSCYHVLPRVSAPTLIISGFWDMITPPMQSVEIARRVPGSLHYCDPFSSHVTILESPEWCVAEIELFLLGLGVSGSDDNTVEKKCGKEEVKAKRRRAAIITSKADAKKKKKQGTKSCSNDRKSRRRTRSAPRRRK
jgi:pimeloyl-ACP methyl ester carboxylesterase